MDLAKVIGILDGTRYAMTTMETPFLLAIIGVSLVMVVAAALLGYRLQGGCGIALLALGAALAAALAVAGAALGGWIGVFVAIVLVWWLGSAAGYKLGGRRGATFAGGIWLGFCLSCAIGFWVGGGLGLIAITFPANLLFWAALYVLSGFLLPVKNDEQGKQAFQSLLTFSLGTNYPYYVMHDRTLEKRADGNPFKAFLSGPGIILTGCDHVVATTDGTRIKTPEEPGLAFTARFEVIQSVVDLRPQLRAFTVDARTSDGIPIQVLTFVPFQIDPGGEKPGLGKPYPFRAEAILRAITREVVEQHQDHKRNWDDLVEIQATRIMRDIISRYKFDDFCLAVGPLCPEPDDILLRHRFDDQASPRDPSREPRYRIRDELVGRLKQEMKDYGIEVIGGGISNLTPVDPSVAEQRLRNWQTKWQARIDLALAEGEARKARLVEPARVEVEHDLLLTMAKMLEQKSASGERLTYELLAATLVASLEQMAENPSIKDRLPTDVRQRLAQLRSLESLPQQASRPARGQGG